MADPGTCSTSASPRARKPGWLKVRAPSGPRYHRLKQMMRELNLHTVCEEARCPNIGECWNSGTATFMLLGDVCTRGCRFCAVKTAKQGIPVDPDEPVKVGRAVAALDLDYIVLTMVDRDDLADGGADHVGRTIEVLHEGQPDLLVEALVGDFRGNVGAVERVVASGVDVYAHNVETVERMTKWVRDRKSSYATSLETLSQARSLGAGRRMLTKSSIMVGLGETEAEVLQTMQDLRDVGVDLLTVGQYLRPSGWHLPVKEFVPPAQFQAYEARAVEMGFRYCASGPLVRSSYKAGEFYIRNILRQEAFEV